MGKGLGWTVSSSDLWAPQRWKSPLTVRPPTPDVPICAHQGELWRDLRGARYGARSPDGVWARSRGAHRCQSRDSKHGMDVYVFEWEEQSMGYLVDRDRVRHRARRSGR